MRNWHTFVRGRRRPPFISLTHEALNTIMAAKRKNAKKSVRKAAARPAATATIKSVLTKSALVAHVAATTEVAAKDVRAVLAALEGAIHASIRRAGARQFVLPGLLKIQVVAVAAKPKRKGINPFTGEETIFKAKPATVKVKVRPMKKLKDAATA